MTELKPFVIRPRPFELESLTGYVIRIADANRFPNAAHVSESPGLALSTPSDFRQLELRLKLADGVLDGRWPSIPSSYHAESDIQVGAVTVTRADIRRRTTHICPTCIEEQGFCHVGWEFRYVVACPYHKCLLVTHCPSCGKWLSDRRGGLLECAYCRYELRPTDASSDVDERVVALAAWLMGAVTGSKRLPKKFPSILADQGVRQGLKLMRTLAWIEYGPKAAWLSRIQGDASQRFAELKGVLGLLDDWPHEWWSTLDRRVSSVQLSANFGLRSLFRREIDQLDIAGDAPRVLRDAFSEWLEGRYPAIRQSSSLGSFHRVKDKESEWLSIADTAGKLGVSERKVRDLLEADELSGREMIFGRARRLLVSTESVHAFQTAQSELLTLKDAAHSLGINRKTVSSLVDLGVLREVKGSNKKARFVQKIEIDHLICEIDRAKKLPSRQPKVGVVGALVMGSNHWSGLVDLIRLILDKQLLPVSFDPESGLRSLVFERIDVAEVLDSLPGDHEASLLTIGEVAKEIGVPQGRILSLFKAGDLIPAELIGKNVKEQRVGKEECRRFRDTYVTLEELAEKFGLPVKQIARRFSWANLEWASSQGGGFIRNFYPREKAESFVRERIVPFYDSKHS